MPEPKMLPEKKPRLTLDTTINIQNMLTAFTIVMVIVSGYVLLISRLIILEQQDKAQVIVDAAQNDENEYNRRLFSETVSEIKGAIVRMEGKIDNISNHSRSNIGNEH